MNFESYAPEANLFLKEVATELGTPQDTDHAYRVTRSVFHTLREVLVPEESAHLISQLPIMLKAIYVDGWNFQPRKDNKIRSMDAFLQCVRSKDQAAATRDFGNDDAAKTRVKAVLGVLQRHVSEGETMHILNQLPGELSELWIAPAHL